MWHLQNCPHILLYHSTIPSELYLTSFSPITCSCSPFVLVVGCVFWKKERIWPLRGCIEILADSSRQVLLVFRSRGLSYSVLKNFGHQTVRSVVINPTLLALGFALAEADSEIHIAILCKSALFITQSKTLFIGSLW